MKTVRKHRQTAARAPTLDDVAHAAGLSSMTVSRALNTPERVRPETVTRVMAAVQATGYIPNALAGGLASRKTRLIAVVVPQINNNMFVDIIQALNDELALNGYLMLLCVSGYAEETESDIVTTLLSRRPDGVVLTGIHHSAPLKKMLLQTAIPVVEIWDMTPTPLDMLIGFSHEKVGVTLGNYLLDKGYTRPSLIWADDRRAAQRKLGLLETLARKNVSIVDEATLPVPASLQSGREAMRNLFDSGTPGDVVLCSSDTLAQGAMMEAQARGIGVPQEMAVIGFGDLDFAATNHPAITTIRIDRMAMGRLAATSLINRIAGNAVTGPIVDIGFQMIVRDSG